MNKHRQLAGLCLLFVICLATRASAEIYAVKTHFSIGQTGEFKGTDFASLEAKEFADAEIAGCAAYGVTCSTEDAAQDAPSFKTFTSADSRSGIEHRGIYRAPEGKAICKAKIDWKNAVVGNGSAFSATLLRNRKDNGLAYVAMVPEGERVEADLYIEYVPVGDYIQYDCFADTALIWNCRGKTCRTKGQISDTYGIYPPARFP